MGMYRDKDSTRATVVALAVSLVVLAILGVCVRTCRDDEASGGGVVHGWFSE